MDCIRLERDIATPIGRPLTTARTVATAISAMVAIACSHTPIRPMQKVIAATDSATAQRREAA